MTSDPDRVLLRVSRLTKSFPGLVAVNDVSFDVPQGQIIALLGPNGSGKSTLVKLLAGVYEADPGSTIELAGHDGQGGESVELHFIHQDLGLVGMLNTVENIQLTKPMGRRALRPNRSRAEQQHARSLLAEFGVDFDVTVPVAELTPAERSIVAIVRALDGWKHEANVLVLDEPTAALHGDEVRRLLDVVRRIAARGTGVIYISHRLDEVLELADEVLVLRDGRLVAQEPRGNFDHEKLVEIISGGSAPTRHARADRSASSEVRLEVSALGSATFEDVAFKVRAGEIVGVSGIVGSGRERLLAAVYGADPEAQGQVSVNGRQLRHRSPARSVRAGIAYVPADRHRDGGVLKFSARENLTLPALRQLTGGAGKINRADEDRQAQRWFEKVGLRPMEPERALELFSGGNQQKVVFARWMRTNPAVLLLDEPTQGVDVGAKSAIHDLVRETADSGTAVLICSSDSSELSELCDRVLLMRDGRIVDELSGESVDETRLTAESLGVGADELEQLFGQADEVHSP